MTVKRFADYSKWHEAVIARGLVAAAPVEAMTGSVDSIYEPVWAIEPEVDGMVYAHSPMFGMYQNVPVQNDATKQTAVISEGFLCDTVEEFEEAMSENETAHNLLNSHAPRPSFNKPTIH